MNEVERSRVVAISLMRMALALLDRYGDPACRRSVQYAIDTEENYWSRARHRMAAYDQPPPGDSGQGYLHATGPVLRRCPSHHRSEATL